MFTRFLLALCALLLPAAGLAQTQAFQPGRSVQDNNPEPVKLMCWSGSAYAPCTFSSGGGGSGGDPSFTGTAGSTTVPTTVAMQGLFDGTTIRRALADTSGRQIVSVFSLPALPTGSNVIGSIANTSFGISGSLPAGSNTIGSIANTTFAATQSGTWTVQIGTGGLGTSGSPIFTQAATATTGAIGSPVPANGVQHAGRDPAGNLRAVATDTGGRLIPGQGAVASPRTPITANSATQISAAVAARIGVTVFAEAALTADVFLCTTQTTACSATNYDFLMPSGNAKANPYTFLFAPSTSLYAFSTAAVTLVVNNWTAQ